MKIEIEITDSKSKTIKYPPDDTEKCDRCHRWIKNDKIDFIDNPDNEWDFKIVCDDCLEKE